MTWIMVKLHFTRTQIPRYHSSQLINSVKRVADAYCYITGTGISRFDNESSFNYDLNTSLQFKYRPEEEYCSGEIGNSSTDTPEGDAGENWTEGACQRA